MDGTRGTLLPPAASFCLRCSQARWGAVHVVGKWMKVPAEELGWNLTQGSYGLSGPSNEEKTSLKCIRRG
jgi:hypothetical protein